MSSLITFMKSLENENKKKILAPPSLVDYDMPKNSLLFHFLT